jgi:hypothetical protein
MALDDRKRQKKLMKKRQKDKQRKSKEARQAAASASAPARRILASRQWPFYQCYINPSWKTHQLAEIVVSRRQPNGNITFGSYIVDTGCLGVKNAFCRSEVTPYEFRTQLIEPPRRPERLERCTPELAHGIIYGALEYAAKLGFKPHPDFELAQNVLDPPGTFGPCEGLQFGRDGKPFYVASPHDNAARVLEQLRKTAGIGNFDFITPIPFGDGSDYDAAPEDEYGSEDEDELAVEDESEDEDEPKDDTP